MDLLQVAVEEPRVSLENLPFTVDKLRPTKKNVYSPNNIIDLNSFTTVDVDHNIVDPETIKLQIVPCDEAFVTEI